MTETLDHSTTHEAHAPPVRSRVSWSAIFAGATVALAVYFLLTLLGAAIGLSVSSRVRPETIGAGAAFWAVFATVISLFIGGYVTTQCSIGENQFESVLYGVILWGVTFGMLMWLVATGVQSGFTAMVGMSHNNQEATDDFAARGREWAARKAGVPADAAEARRAPTAEESEMTRQAATRVTWWAFAGTLLSMLAAVAGSFAGTGSRFRMGGTSYVLTRGDGAVRQRASV